MVLSLSPIPGEIVWENSEFPFPLEDLVPDKNGSKQGQTSWQHGRSVYLGAHQALGQELHVFAKGLGWTQGWYKGWGPPLGSMGILPLRAALWEKQMALKVNSLGLDCSIPLGVVRKSTMFDMGGLPIDTNSVPDLDGTPAEPSLYYFALKSRQRLSEVGDIQLDELKKTIAYETGLANDGWKMHYVEKIANCMLRASCAFHQNGGHNYSASSHNMTIAGELVDFEYCVLGIDHWETALNVNPAGWQEKELLGWLSALAQLLEELDLDIDRQSFALWFFDNYVALKGLSDLPLVRSSLDVQRSSV
jgi:hypothetical protein